MRTTHGLRSVPTCNPLISVLNFLQTFLETYRPDMDPATNFSVVGIDGGSNDQDVPSVSEGVCVHIAVPAS